MAPARDEVGIEVRGLGELREASEGRGQETTSLTTARAAAQARIGDRGALLYLYAAYADDVYGHVRTIVDDHDKVLDVTQSVFASLSGLLERHEEEEVPFAIWIRRVAHGVAAEIFTRSESPRGSYSA